MAFQRLRESTAAGFVIHVDYPFADDRTLCGYAYEGSCVENEGDSGVEPVERGKVNCADCLAIIWHSKDIPMRYLAPVEIGKIKKVTRT